MDCLVTRYLILFITTTVIWRCAAQINSVVPTAKNSSRNKFLKSRRAIRRLGGFWLWSIHFSRTILLYVKFWTRQKTTRMATIHEYEFQYLKLGFVLCSIISHFHTSSEIYYFIALFSKIHLSKKNAELLVGSVIMDLFKIRIKIKMMKLNR